MRPIADHEKPLVDHMLRRASISIQIDNLPVESMADGGMGSLLFYPGTQTERKTLRAANATFLDADGVPVSVQLNVDENGLPFELDVWKVNFEPLVRWPKAEDIVDENLREASN